MDWQIPLVVSAVVFAAFMVFRFRPAISSEGRASAAALREAKARVASAGNDASRASALCDAADASVHLGRFGAGASFYARALRLSPASTEIAERAAAGLAARPAVLEKLMWRHLAANPWVGDGRAAALVGLRALAQAYAKRPRFQSRVRAIEHAQGALEALGEPAPPASRG